MRVERTSSPIASRNMANTRGRSKPAAKARVNSLSARASATPSQGSSALVAGARASTAALERSVASSRVSRRRSCAWRSAPSRSRGVKVAGRLKSAR